MHAQESEFYLSLIWLFVIIITFLMLFLCYLYLAIKRALRRESMSLAFSHLAIEGMETERRRVSRELHDVVLPLVRQEQVSDIIRTICMELMPPDFSKLSLNDSFNDLCARFSARTLIKCVCFIDEQLNFKKISAENQLHLYRIIQEAFTNIEKHSKATEASLVVRRLIGSSTENILICVSDDGIGLRNEPSNLRKGSRFEGLGMMSMRQRAAIIGAKLDFISESGNGLMVRIEFPPPRGKFGAISWIKLQVSSLLKIIRLCVTDCQRFLPQPDTGKLWEQPPRLPKQENC